MELRGVLFCWMANLRAIRRAIDEGCNLIVCHEAPFFGPAVDNDYAPFREWRANRLRSEALHQHGLAVAQAHRTLDAFCVPEVFQERQGLVEPATVEQMAGYGAVRLFRVRPTPIGQLIGQWKEAMGLECLRVYAPDLGRVVGRIGLAWGGIGLHSNMGVLARLAELGAEQ